MTNQPLVDKINKLEQEIKALETSARQKKTILETYKDALKLISGSDSAYDKEQSLPFNHLNEKVIADTKSSSSPSWERLRCSPVTKRVYEIVRDSDFGASLAEIRMRLEADGFATNRHTARVAAISGEKRGILSRGEGNDKDSYYITESGKEFLRQLDEKESKELIDLLLS
jgi:hypothetical protein